MGMIASKFADVIYLTDDNPRSENPKKIRRDIKKGNNSNNLAEMPNRKKAIFNCINDLASGDIAIIAGKGHEKTQDYNGKKNFFLIEKKFLSQLILKNKKLFNDKRLNIIQEKLKHYLKN